MRENDNREAAKQEAYVHLMRQRQMIQELQASVDRHAHGLHVPGPITHDSVGAAAAAAIDERADEFVTVVHAGLSEMIKAVDQQLDELS